MSVPALTPRSAWLPLTPRGVAAFAHARYRRLLIAQVIVAALAGMVIILFLRSAWLPPWREALRRLPVETRLAAGRLEWQDVSPRVLAENPFVSFTVDLDHSGAAATTAQVQVQFGERDWQIASVFGVLDLAQLDTRYPLLAEPLPLDRTAAEPWWAAREPFFLLFAGLMTAAALMLTWLALATLYTPVVWLAGFFANRDLNWPASWRLAGAALLPGALLQTAAVLFYGWRVFGLGQLALAFALHFVLGWIYLLVSPLFLPRHPGTAPARANPFQPRA